MTQVTELQDAVTTIERLVSVMSISEERDALITTAKAARRVANLDQLLNRLSNAIKSLHTRSDDGSWVDHEEDWSELHDVAVEVLAALGIKENTE